MVYIKKLVMHGFKSFQRKTEMPFNSKINVIFGPNGSGKSNISEALCFVLGRLSAKSIRASKSSNLIFLGNKDNPPSKEASVEIVLDNKGRTFNFETDEISLKRIVRKNGTSIYKINNQTKTRQDIISLLSQAGIDPNGFNIILQWEIQNFVRMASHERRKILEEVSGISIYEIRKEKSLKELDKTEDKLKEVSTILRERTIHLNNLEKERQLALKFKKMEEYARRCKASIVNHDITVRRKETEKIESDISHKNKIIDKMKSESSALDESNKNLQAKIDSINSSIKKSTGLEQEKLNQEITNLMADIAGMNARIENYENKIAEISKQKIESERTVKENESSIRELQKEPLRKKQDEINRRKNELEKIESERKKFYSAKSELKSLRERIEDKKKILGNYKSESDFLLKQIDFTIGELFDKKSTIEKINSMKISLKEKEQELEIINKKEREHEKILYANESEIKKHENLIEKLSKMEICPVCKSKITNEHTHNIGSETKEQISILKKEMEKSKKEISNIQKSKDLLKKEIIEINSKISLTELDMTKISNIEDKKERIKTIEEKISFVRNEISNLEKTKSSLNKILDESSNIEERYEKMKVEVEEISMRSRENVDSEISYKQMELERAKISLKQFNREEEDLLNELNDYRREVEEKENLLDEKRNEEEELSDKFKSLISERDSNDKKIRENQTKILELHHSIRNVENEVNNLKIDIARISASLENLEIEFTEFKDVELIKASREALVEKLNSTEFDLSRIKSNVNLMSLKVYDSVKEEYDKINEKVEIIKKEKESILSIIHDIDTKKKKTFLKTLNSLNEIFSRNFSSLSTKGMAYLELENPKEPFEGGLGIVIKTGHGKYMDVTSLSGGERVLVALSLLFAIQELNPYHFYILDEVDASLDKRNSERLANLFNKYMQKGQYIIITHNDEILSKATNLYGVSMNDGVSKVISMQV
ncbi:MAG TPA: chromosome segregation SMC family protein [Candidatus Nanoarchaeia archaeon]|nr:chromosome segregation SMC family protein [Candidatus Nanoarchaeia archaeon]